MRVLHCSDFHLLPHLGGVPISDWMSKRATGALNYWWERKGQFALTPKKIEKLAEFAARHAVDAILCTGDFTLWGTEKEHVEARRAIQPLVDAASAFVTLPGNHDVYTRRVVDEQRFERNFGDLLATDRPESAVDAHWPLVRFLGDTAVAIAVSSSIPHAVPWRASGRIPDTQIEELRRLLRDPEVRARAVFVMTHHAPRLANGNADAPQHGLANAQEFLEACSAIETGAILFGHVHRTYRLDLPELDAPLFNSGSTTLFGREGLWLFDVADGTVSARRGTWNADRYVLSDAS